MLIQKPAFEIIHDLENSWQKIKNEYELVISEDLHIKWHESFLYSGDWNVFGLIARYKPIGDTCKHCRETLKILKRYEKLICNAGFSILAPNTTIHPHKGYTNEVLRCHLGLDVPEGNCYLEVGGKRQKWKNGKAFIFDDTTLHSAWNKTEKKRTIMILDLNRQLLLKQ